MMVIRPEGYCCCESLDHYFKVFFCYFCGLYLHRTNSQGASTNKFSLKFQCCTGWSCLTTSDKWLIETISLQEASNISGITPDWTDLNRRASCRTLRFTRPPLLKEECHMGLGKLADSPIKPEVSILREILPLLASFLYPDNSERSNLLALLGMKQKKNKCLIYYNHLGCSTLQVN